MQPPRGPVFISDPDGRLEQAVRAGGRAQGDADRFRPIRAALDEVVRRDRCEQETRAVAGAQIEEDGAKGEVVALAEKLNADVYAEPIASRWAFPRSHRLFRGGLLPARKPLADQLAGYDTVVVLGAPVFLYYAFVPGNAIAPGTRLFQITNSPQDASTALAGTSIVGNLKAAAEYLAQPREAGRTHSSGANATARADNTKIR